MNIIGVGDYFNTKFHLKFTNELVALHKNIVISNEDLKELFIAFLNEQELLNKINQMKFLDTTIQLNAFDLQNSVMIRNHLPDNPQNFIALSEAMISLGNLFLRYLTYSKVNDPQNTTSNISEEDFFKILGNIFQVTNKYYVIKDHYDGCLFYNGKIEIFNDEKIYFNSCENELHLYEQISVTCIENQRMNRLYYYEFIAKQKNGFKEWVFENSAKQILLNVTVEKGFVKYRLRKRTFDDYSVYLDYMRSIHDYYPFYSLNPLVNFKNLTVTNLLRLHSELKNLVVELYFKDFPSENKNQIKKFITNFLPKIKHSVLKSYLMSVTKYGESQVELFIELLTVVNNGTLDLYETPLLKKDDYYYFPYLPLAKPNYLFLIDYWLERAGESLDTRGKALEKYVKEKLKSVENNEYNKFRLIEESNFKIDDKNKEEIDLVIQTKNTLIVGEIKCSKYPMYERDYYGILNSDVIKAVKQLNRKCQFLINNQEYFKELYTIEGKKIIKVIILNFPVFTGAEVEGIPIIDINYFLAYFQSDSMVIREFGENEMEEVKTIPYYINENEFCDNLESYLKNPPIVKMYLDQLETCDCSYKLNGLPEIIFRSVNPVNEKSKLIENNNKTP